MRTYPSNSPQAAARIVALTLLADGHLSRAELDLLDRLQVGPQLGLPSDELHAVLHGFCHDLLSGMHLTWSDACQVDPRTLEQMMGEIADPALRLKVLQLCVALAEGDDHVAEGEEVVLNAAVEHWGLHREMLRPTAH